MDTNKFEERLQLLLCSRKIHAWGDAMGLGKTILTRMNKGILPGAEKLIPVIKAENISLTWLIEGKGHPFMVNTCLSDSDATALLDELYAESWTTYLLTDGDRIGIVLTQPGEYEFEDTTYPYTIVEVLVGNLGRETLQRAAAEASPGNTNFIETEAGIMDELIRGNIGTYRLTTEILPTATAYGTRADHAPLLVAEAKSHYLPDNISSREADTINALRQLDPRNRDHIQALIEALTKKEER